MKEKKYKVCKGKKLTGRRKVMTEDRIFAMVDFIGDIDTAIENGLCKEFKEKEPEPKLDKAQKEKDNIGGKIK